MNTLAESETTYQGELIRRELIRRAEAASHDQVIRLTAISIDTFRTHLKKACEKLHVHSQTEAAIKALQETLV